ALGPEEAKARWKYLRDNYAKARKKAKAYIPSGSAAKTGGLKKSKFRFYDLMTFLKTFLKHGNCYPYFSNDADSHSCFSKNTNLVVKISRFSANLNRRQRGSVSPEISPALSKTSPIPATNSKTITLLSCFQDHCKLLTTI
ncbi:hypothetical protein DBV15_12264, partial [Temnothorax longispinosus]